MFCDESEATGVNEEAQDSPPGKRPPERKSTPSKKKAMTETINRFCHGSNSFYGLFSVPLYEGGFCCLSYYCVTRAVQRERSAPFGFTNVGGKINVHGLVELG